MLAQVVKSSPLAGSSESYTLFLLSITSAKKAILISNPYFIPDEHIAEALVKAVARGVRVIVLVLNKIDNPLTHAVSRSGYGPLLRGRVQIYEYTAALLHSKTMVIDGTWATIGSTNLDSRSLALNEELNLTVYDSSLANRLEQIFYQDLKYARQVSLKEWNSRSLAERFLELFAFPLKDQL